MPVYNIIDADGMFCAQGLQPPSVCDAAVQAAQKIANERGARVWLIPSDLPEAVSPFDDRDERVRVFVPEMRLSDLLDALHELDWLDVASQVANIEQIDDLLVDQWTAEEWGALQVALQLVAHNGRDIDPRVRQKFRL